MSLAKFIQLSSLIRQGNVSLFRDCYNETSDHGMTDISGRGLLYYAIEYQQVDVAQYLLSHLQLEPESGAASDDEPVMVHVIRQGHPQMIRLFHEQGVTLPEFIDGLPIAHFLLQQDTISFDGLELLVQLGVDINEIDQRITGLTPLAYYLGQSHCYPSIERVNQLIVLGANILLGQTPYATPLYQLLKNPLIEDRQQQSTLGPRCVELISALNAMGRLTWEIPAQASHIPSVFAWALEYDRVETFILLLRLHPTVPEWEKADLARQMTIGKLSSDLRKQIIELNEMYQLALPFSILFYPPEQHAGFIEALPDNNPVLNYHFYELLNAGGVRASVKKRYLQQLLDKGADINAPTECYGRLLSPLLQLVVDYHRISAASDLVPWLLARGALTECHGYSAFLHAVWHEHIGLATLFLEHQADPFFQEADGATLASKLFTPDYHGETFRVSRIAELLVRLHRLLSSYGYALDLTQSFVYNYSNNGSLSRNSTLLQIVDVITSVDAFTHYALALREIGWPVTKTFQSEIGGYDLMTLWMLEQPGQGDDIRYFLQQLPECEVNQSGLNNPICIAFNAKLNQASIFALLDKCTDINRTLIHPVNDDTYTTIKRSYLHHVLRAYSADEHHALGLPILERILQQGADPNQLEFRQLQNEQIQRNNTSRRQLTPLEMASMYDNPGAVRLLLDYGADPRQMTGPDQEQLIHFMTWRGKGGDPEAFRAILEILKERELLDLEAVNGSAYPNSALCYTAMGGKLELMQILLEMGANPDGKENRVGWSAMQHVIGTKVTMDEQRRAAIVNLLLDYGANPNHCDVDNDTPLTVAAASGCLSVMKALLARGGNPGMRTLTGLMAIHAVVEYDLSFEADSTAADPLTIRLGMIQALVAAGCHVDAREHNTEAHTPIVKAILKDQPILVKGLIKLGANLQQRDIQGRSLLMMALEHASTATIEGIVEALGNNFDVSECDNHGNTVFHAVCGNDDSKLAAEFYQRLVRQYGLQPIGNRRGETPLHVAARHGHLEVVRLWIQDQFRVDDADIDGNTPLLTAMMSRHHQGYSDRFRQMILELLLTGADPRHQNRQGQSPLDVATYAYRGEYLSIMQLAVMNHHSSSHVHQLTGRANANE